MFTSAKVGDTVWVASVGNTERSRPCSVCNGNKAITLIFGDGSNVRVECAFCKMGYEAPSGYETYYEFVATSKPYTVSAVERVESSSGEVVKYRVGSESSYYNFDAEDCFATSEDGAARCAELVAEKEAEHLANFARKSKDTQSYSWNAGYHLREAKNRRTQAEYHEKKAVVMKSKSKQEAV